MRWLQRQGEESGGHTAEEQEGWPVCGAACGRRSMGQDEPDHCVRPRRDTGQLAEGQSAHRARSMRKDGPFGTHGGREVELACTAAPPRGPGRCHCCCGNCRLSFNVTLTGGTAHGVRPRVRRENWTHDIDPPSPLRSPPVPLTADFQLKWKPCREWLVPIDQATRGYPSLHEHLALQKSCRGSG